MIGLITDKLTPFVVWEGNAQVVILQSKTIFCVMKNYMQKNKNKCCIFLILMVEYISAMVKIA